MVTAGSWPRWLIASGMVPMRSVVTAFSGTMVGAWCAGWHCWIAGPVLRRRCCCRPPVLTLAPPPLLLDET